MRMLLVLSFLAIASFGPAAAANAPAPATRTIDGNWNLVHPGSFPGPQEAQAQVFDPVRRSMVIFGGWDGTNALAVTRALDLAGTPSWRAILPTGPLPPGRYAHSMVYDSARDRVIVFGGRDASLAYADVWTLNLSGPPVWTQLFPAGTGPSARFGHEAIYDPVRDRMLVYLGFDGVMKNDLWELSFSGTPTWTQLTPAGTPPTARDYTASIYDPAGDRVVLFGGNADAFPNPPAPVNDTWTLSLAGTPTWAPLSTVGSPPPRILHKACYDAASQTMYVMGGYDGFLYRGNTYKLTLAGTPAWSSVPTGGPAPRSDHSLVFDAPGNRLILFGGRNGGGFLEDVWELKPGIPLWSHVVPGSVTNPSPRLLDKGAYDPARRQFVVHGGYGYPTGWVDDLWGIDLDTNTWSKLDGASAIRPLPRSDQVMIADPPADRLVMFGGRDLNNFFGDLWQFDFASGQWSGLTALGTPPSPRDGMAAIYDPLRDRMLMFGGWDGSNAFNEVWELTLGAAPTWTLLTPDGVPPQPRIVPSMVYDSVHDRIVTYSGFVGPTVFDDVWMLSLGGVPTWSQAAVLGPTPGRYADFTIYDPVRDRMVLFGGWDGSFRNDVRALSLGTPTPTWSVLSPAGGPPKERDYMAGFYDATLDRMLIFGGNAASRGYDDTWTLDWTQIPTPALLSFAEESVEPGMARLTWFTPDGPGQRATAYRSTDGRAWDALGTLESDASSRFVLEDRVAAGGRYAYRLGIASGIREEFTEPHWTTFPGTLALALNGASPNPSFGRMQVRFSLPTAAKASLDLVDVRGRRVLHRDVTALGAGAHVVDLDGELKPGVYMILLTQGDRSERQKVAIVR